MKKMKRIISLILIFSMALLLAFSFTACEMTNEASYDYEIFYTNSTKDDVVSLGVNIENKDSLSDAEIAEELLNQLFNETLEDGVHYLPISSDFKYNGVDINGSNAAVDFDGDFSNLSNVEIQILKASIGLTLSQIESINTFTVTSGGSIVTDKNGNVLNMIRTDSFVGLNDQSSELLEKDFSLDIYFSNKAGNLLVLKTLNFKETENVSSEEIIINALKEGVNDGSADAYPTLSSDCELINVSTIDGICYVNFDENFLDQESSVNDEVMVYSIVNSLCNLSYVDSVKFLVEGDPNVNLHMTIDLSLPLTANNEIVQ